MDTAVELRPISEALPKLIIKNQFSHNELTLLRSCLRDFWEGHSGLSLPMQTELPGLIRKVELLCLRVN